MGTPLNPYRGTRRKLALLFFLALTVMLGSAGPASAAATPGSSSAQTQQTSSYAPIAPVQNLSPQSFLAPVNTAKWIDINLTKQLLVAYVGNTRVFSTLISSGIAKHPTTPGTFHIYAKLLSQEMKGGVGIEHYDLPGVPYVMYFYGANAIHGTYWHHNFGHPMSHGCINANTDAAKFLYYWAPMGTTVRVHY